MESIDRELENPFTPSFGEIPAHMAGRRDIVNSIERAFRSERRRPELTTLLSGARGMGKTSLMASLAHKAEALGWIAVSVTALPGMLADIEIGTRRAARHLLPEQESRHISGIGIAPLGSVQFTHDDQAESNWRYRMTDMLDVLAESGTGLLLTVDELDPHLDEMIELAAVYQHFVQEGYRVALLMAGLPHNVSALLNNKTVSFLRRAQQFRLGRVADCDVRDAFERTIIENGRKIERDGLDVAVSEIGGFPFLMQLIGFRTWDVHQTHSAISVDDVQRGAASARAEMNDRILEATFRELSDEDIRFLTAMLEDEEETRASDLVERLQRSSAQVAQYRKRLIDAGVIGERRRGYVAFELPYFREFLNERVQGI